MKLTPVIGHARKHFLPALIYRRRSVETNQTAHISLQILAMSNSAETKTNRMRPNLSARPPVNTSNFLLRLVTVSSASPPRRRPVWRPVVRLSAAGEGAFTVTSQNPQPLFDQTMIFSSNNRHNQTISMTYTPTFLGTFSPPPRPNPRAPPQIRLVSRQPNPIHSLIHRFTPNQTRVTHDSHPSHRQNSPTRPRLAPTRPAKNQKSGPKGPRLVKFVQNGSTSRSVTRTLFGTQSNLASEPRRAHRSGAAIAHTS